MKEVLNLEDKTRALENKLDDLLYEARKLEEGDAKRLIEQEIREIFNVLQNFYAGNNWHPVNFKQAMEDHSERKMTISCIELTMKHDIAGNVLDWMSRGK